MSFIEEFKSRGYLYQCTNIEQLHKLMESNKIIAYVGFDCTAKSLHIGSLMQIMILRLLQQYGHKLIIIIGGATSKIGDPTGKDEIRKALTQEEIIENSEGIKRSLSKFIRFGSGESDALLLNNIEWLNSINYLEFLRDFGTFFSINRMLSMDSVKLRLQREQHLSFLEFNYMLLQAYDFYYLNQKYNCCLQLGGSDQWGNIIIGVDLIKKLINKEAYGITTPLLTTVSGCKMGKSVGGAIWLNEDMLSPYDYYQYWRNCADSDIIKFAKLYSEFNVNEMKDFELLANSDINSAKKKLAFKITKLCHSEKIAASVLETATKLFEQGEIDHNLPTIFIEYEKLKNGIKAYDLLVEVGFANSKSDGRKLIRGKGAKINNQIIQDENMLINCSMLNDHIIKISSGKKKHILIKVKTYGEMINNDIQHKS